MKNAMQYVGSAILIGVLVAGCATDSPKPMSTPKGCNERKPANPEYGPVNTPDCGIIK